MSLSDTPEIADAFGAYDSVALERGNAVDAHLVRNVIRNSNRLSAKGEHIVTLGPWAQPGEPFNSYKHYRWIPTTHWTRLLPPVPIAYRRGLRTAEVRLHARVSSTHTVTLQIGTKAQPFSVGATSAGTNTLDLVGVGGSADSYEKTGLLLDPSGYDELDIRAIAEPTTDLADDTLGGANERSDVGGVSYFSTFVTTTPASWWTASPSQDSFANLGTEVAFDVTGSGYTDRRLLILTGTRHFFFAPILDDVTLNAVQSFDDFVLYQLPTLGLMSLTIAAEGRSL